MTKVDGNNAALHPLLTTEGYLPNRSIVLCYLLSMSRLHCITCTAANYKEVCANYSGSGHGSISYY